MTEDSKNDVQFNFRLPQAERDALEWLAAERTREIREAAKVSSIKVTAAEALRELVRNETERRGYAPAKRKAK
jgi:hypothetical protein